MENQLQAAAERAGRPHARTIRQRAGLRAKRFYARFSGLNEVPAKDLEFLSEGLKKALDLDPASQVPALQALVRQELQVRREEGRS